jgi:glycosyltransferase involved in cell wall biosynthesis
VADPLSVVFCWAEVAGYMPPCWRALAARPDVRVHILHPRQLSETAVNPFDVEPMMAGLSHEMFDNNRADIEQWLMETVRRHHPDVIVLSGWVYWPYMRLLKAPAFARTRFILAMDTPWVGALRQRVGRWRLGHLIDRVSAVVTASSRSAEYARRLGTPVNRIHKGLYGFNRDPLQPVAERRRAGQWPRQFLFVGRYVDQKDLPLLVAAYRDYRRQVTDPWGLTCCGSGPESHVLQGVEGLTDIGFKQPHQMADVLAAHGTFVIASKFEPWGVVIAEAAASGMPVISTSACGATDDLVRSYYNGLIVGAGDAAALARAMRWIHAHEHELPQLGERGRQLAEPFAAEHWAARWHHFLADSVV